MLMASYFLINFIWNFNELRKPGCDLFGRDVISARGWPDSGHADFDHAALAQRIPACSIS
jgi:hypothetical protein